jgi:hypothetical protein
MPTMLDNLKPNMRKQMEMKLWHEQQEPLQRKTFRTFNEGEEVWVKNEDKPGWTAGTMTAGTIHKCNGLYSYEVMCAGNLKRKHADHLRRREGAIDDGGGKM